MIQLWRIFGDVVPLFFVISLIVVTLSVWRFRSQKTAWEQKVPKISLLLTMIAILLITVFPFYYIPDQPRVLNLVPFVGMYRLIVYSVDIEVPIRNILLNVLLFVPFGFFLSWSANQLSVRNITMTGLLFSFIIEVFQYVLPIGRSADIDDVILNTLGAFFGAVVWKGIEMYRKQSSASF
ncbi:VanZ family protein [Thermaerobacillus caldiproteolyticus]|uniref:Glycopeptide antibiotics resistance protein n=1 Tax=Thermaerobacillus caldiproteolyticus TaxID=247480 RepID=A0A7V9Z741_9BACL|nr:VanZ family protein [Anoxybacillus caldiproteolyticus]MBA2875158.1 glycopeptide antibiotics resistance protein [Anoxybacillus caldiproteolyticus]